MKKNKGMLVALLMSAIFIVGCASTNVAISPAEFEYKEIKGSEFCNSTSNLMTLFQNSKGYKLTDVYILGAVSASENGVSEVLLRLTAPKNGKEIRVYATEFVKNMQQTDPAWADRIDAVKDDEKYNGHYTIYLYGHIEGNAWVGYTAKSVLYNIDGIPTQEQINADKAAAEAERITKEEADKKAREEKKEKLNAIGKQIAKGYVYHGIEEDSKSSKLFTNGALEEGHAYYISGFVVKYGGAMAKIEYGDGLFISSQSNAVYVDYISQKVKGEIVEAGVTDFFGKTIESPLNVVVAGGKAPLHMPVILGLVKE